MAQTLIVAARKILQPADTHIVNPVALASILEAAVSTVPPALLERVILRGTPGAELEFEFEGESLCTAHALAGVLSVHCSLWDADVP